MGAEFWDLYSGKRAILGDALLAHDPFDQYSWCQEWRYALADYLTFNHGEPVPGYEPALNHPETDSYAYEMIVSGHYSIEQAQYAFDTLTRYREWLRLAGQES